MDFTNYEETLNQRSANQKKGINSHIHDAALEVSEYVGEPKKFALWLGIQPDGGSGSWSDTPVCGVKIRVTKSGGKVSIPSQR
jgi:hypothetical protein